MDEHRTELMLAERADRVEVGPPPVDMLMNLGRRRRARRRTTWVGALVMGAAGVVGVATLLDSREQPPSQAQPAATPTPSGAEVRVNGDRVELVEQIDLEGEWVRVDGDDDCLVEFRIDEDGAITPRNDLKRLSCAIASELPGAVPRPLPGVVRFEVNDDMLIAFDRTGDRIATYQRVP